MTPTLRPIRFSILARNPFALASFGRKLKDRYAVWLWKQQILSRRQSWPNNCSERSLD